MDPVGWYTGLPRITRWYTTACAVVTGLCALDVLHPFDLYFNSRLVLRRGEWWRVPASFFYFGESWVEFGFQMFFLTRYARSLEEGSFLNRTGDCLWMFLLMSTTIALLAPYSNVQFLGPSLAFALVYLWGRRNASTRLSFLGLFEFSAPYLPWVLVALSIAMGGRPAVDVLGLIAGHLYFFLDDVYPTMPGGRRITAAPSWVARALGQTARAPDASQVDLGRRGLRAGAGGEERAAVVGEPREGGGAPPAGHVLGRGGENHDDAPPAPPVPAAADPERTGLFGIPLDDRAVAAAREAREESSAAPPSAASAGASSAPAPVSPRAAALEALRDRVRRGEPIPLGDEPAAHRGAPDAAERERRRAAAARAAERRAAAAAGDGDDEAAREDGATAARSDGTRSHQASA